jgi:ArsR family transcriptional regulator
MALHHRVHDGPVNPSRILDRSGEAARGFDALADPARLAILEAVGRGTRCVCEMGPELGLAQNLLSYHLRILREAGLVVGSRRGRRIEYRIESDALEDLRRQLHRLTGSDGTA